MASKLPKIGRDAERDSIFERIEKLRNDKAFQERLERVLEHSREALELLSK